MTGEDALRRDAELETGSGEAVVHEELVSRVRESGARQNVPVSSMTPGKPVALFVRHT